MSDRCTNVRRITSKLLLRYKTSLEETGRTWNDIDWEDLELDSGPGGRTENTTVKIINSCPVWKEIFEEQRKATAPFYSYCDVQIHGSDGYVPAHLIYLQRVSGLVNVHVTSLPPYAAPFSSNNVLGLTLADVKVDHIRTVLTLLYCGVALVHRNNWAEVRHVMDLLQIRDIIFEEEPVPRKGTVPRRFQQVLIYRLRAAGTVQSMEQGARIAIDAVALPLPFPMLLPPPLPALLPPPLPLLSSAKAKTPSAAPTPSSSIICNVASSKSCTTSLLPSSAEKEVVGTPADVVFARKEKLALQSSKVKEDKIQEKIIKPDEAGRYRKRASRSSESFYEGEDSDLEFRSKRKKKFKKEVKLKACSHKKSKSSHIQTQLHPPEEKRKLKQISTCYFCSTNYNTEDELNDHLEAQCGRSLKEFFDLEDRFCYGCECSFKNYDATEFMDHVGFCVSMNKNRGRTRRSTATVEMSKKEEKGDEDESSSSDSDEDEGSSSDSDEDESSASDSDEDDLSEVEAQQVRMAIVSLDRLTDADVTRVKDKIRSGEAVSLKRAPAEPGQANVFGKGQIIPAGQLVENKLTLIKQAKRRRPGPKSKSKL